MIRYAERPLMEQMDYNLLFRWFVGLSRDAPVWDLTVFTKNRNRRLKGDVATKFLTAVVAQARGRNLLSDDHFSVDGTLIDAWASMKSFRPKDTAGTDDDTNAGGGRNAERDFRGETRSNDTHASTTDPDARLFRKGNGQSSRLAFMGHVLMENRNGLVVAADLTRATGTAERDATLAMLDRVHDGRRRITLAADKGYDVMDFVSAPRARRVTPRIARNDHVTKTGKRRWSAIDGRATRHAGYAVSRRIRKRIEEVFGWSKAIGVFAQIRHRGVDRVGWMFTLQAAAYTLVRLPKMMGAA